MPPLFGFSFSDARHYFPYILLVLVSVAGVWLIAAVGTRLNPRPPVIQAGGRPVFASQAATKAESTEVLIGNVLRENLRSPLSILLTQIVVIIVVAGLFSKLFQRIRQPPVMGEMIAGIFLGPSVLGLLYPQAMSVLFPPSSVETLQLLSQIGVLLFMFVVGMELNVRHLREKGSAAVMISHASIVVPFLLGTALSLFLYRGLASPGTSFNAFALFIGVAMSITAFPVLARILEDRGMSQSSLGTIAITCAAVDDVTAWCILALVIALVKASGIALSLFTIVFTVLFVCAILFIIRPRLGQLINKRPESQLQSRRLVAGMLVFILLCALLTETIGVHSLFGAFVAGVAMPSSEDFRMFLREKLETFSSSALLPLFFAFTGLRTQISLLNDWQSWLTCLAIILVAILGKLGGSMLMSRWTGMSWTDSFSIGVLMNTRGLVELVVLNIGYDLGILSGRIFAMMVLMALVTTFMTGPLLSLVKIRPREAMPT